jgi:acetolactate synthase-1/2/3 large subunit
MPGDRRPIAADLLLQSLADHGVDYFFANSGTDFAPVVEAFSRAAQSNAKVPQPVLVPHENLALAMAHGVYLMNGRPQAVMVHVNVGTANTIANLANLSRERAPVLLMAGRTPFTEKGRFGSRNRPIHWAQEMFDQAGMVREFVKWDYELRTPEQTGDAIGRAYEMAMTSPRGPIYLALPREPMSAVLDEMPEPGKPRVIPATPRPDPQAVAQLADWIAAAERPLIITGVAGGRTAVAALAKLTEDCALPLIGQNARIVALPSSHPMLFGFDPTALVPHADLIIVIECDVPWYPALTQPAKGCRVAHIGEDPMFKRYPMRSFRSDLAIAADVASTLEALGTQMQSRLPEAKARIDARRKLLTGQAQTRRAQLAKEAKPSGDAISLAALSHAIGEALPADAILFNESALMLDHCAREQPETLFGLPPAGGLGWGFGAALGAKLAAPDRLVVAALGDGAYLFANPTVGHWLSTAYKLPILIIIFNNSRYGAVRRASLYMFKDGATAANDGRLFADLDPSPAYEELARVHGAFAERVEKPEDLAGAIKRAQHAVMTEGRQALLNVICPY